MLTTPEQLRGQIRFALQQLSERNEHHRFEHLARQFARLRIASNVLPATGPVSGGGDQGRDFETFRSYIANTPIASSTFVARVQSKKLIFACSLQHDIESKIRTDVHTIMESSEHIDEIHYLCGADLQVSRRHALQEWARTAYGVDLEIIDGQAISEHLTDPEVWWIAQEFLSIPSAVFPRSFSEGGHYGNLRKKWLEDHQQPFTFADFVGIDAGLREAVYESGCRADLPLWITKIREFLRDGCGDQLRRKVQYEVAVASFRGLNRLSAELALITDFFETLSERLSPAELDDACVLLTFCSTAALDGHFEIGLEVLAKWSLQLIALLEGGIARRPSAGVLCSLILTRAHACTFPFRASSVARPPDFDLAFEYWLQLLTLVPNAPLFPLEYFADVLTKITPILSKDPRFGSFTDRVDRLLEERTGGFVAAEKCRERAIALYDQEDFVGALKQVQRAKLKWFAAETISSSMTAMLLAAHCYERLGLSHAAKYYAAGVFHLSANHDESKLRNYAEKGAFLVADCCYAAGDSLSFFEVLHLALRVHMMYAPDPFDVAEHEDVNRHLFHAAVLLGLTERLAPDLLKVLEPMGKGWNVPEDLWEVVYGVFKDESSPWRKMNVEDIWKEIQKQGLGPLFGDVGAQRTIRWQALGISWAVSFNNTYEVTLLGEEIAATLQILQADLADTDLCLLPTTADIELKLVEESRITFERIPDNTKGRWRLGLPRSNADLERIETTRPFALTLATTILAECSVLPATKFNRILESALEDGLVVKAFSIRPARKLLGWIISKESFETLGFDTLESPEPPEWFTTGSSPQLAWRTSPGPGYSPKTAEEFLRNRYERMVPPIRLTLPRLIANPRTRLLLKKMHEEGMLDWQILSVIMSAVVNFRIHHEHGRLASTEIVQAAYPKWLDRDEQPQDPIFPLRLFNEKYLKIGKALITTTALKTWDLMPQSPTPDIAAIERFLNIRYRHSLDDIVHAKLFPDWSPDMPV